jgi:hypothetical protein
VRRRWMYAFQQAGRREKMSSEGINEFYSKIGVVESADAANEDKETDESSKSVTVTVGPEVCCPVNNWFYKIPNQETLDRVCNYFLCVQIMRGGIQLLLLGK